MVSFFVYLAHDVFKLDLIPAQKVGVIDERTTARSTVLVRLFQADTGLFGR
jgi:hypothetical protein